MATSRRRLGALALGLTAVVAVAAPALAEVRSARDGGSGKRARVDVSHRRVAYSPAPSTSARRHAATDHGVYAREIAEAAALHGVPERLIRAVIRVESGFDPRAVSPSGAQGLMQLMPETAGILGVRDAFDPRENIHGGTRHLKAMLLRFGHDLRLALAAYNAGARPVLAHRGVPPYPETRAYVARVLRFYGAANPSRQAPAGSILRLVRPDGTIVYTNIPYGPARRPIDR